MSSTILLVKNMVCNRCAMVVENILKKSEIKLEYRYIFFHIWKKKDKKQTKKDKLYAFDVYDNTQTPM